MKSPQVSEKNSSNQFNQQLKQLRAQRGQSVASIAKALNIHRNTQQNYELNRDPSIDYLLAFSELVDTPFWQLIRERVEQSSCNQRIIDRAISELGPLFNATKSNPISYKVRQLADSTNNNNKRYGLPAVLQQLIEQYNASSGIEVFRQPDHSMANKIGMDDWLVIDTNNTTVCDGEIYLIEFNQHYVARRLQNHIDGGLLIVSDNPKFDRLQLNTSQRLKLNIIGKMTFYISHQH